jgi:AraC family transcriptional regulator
MLKLATGKFLGVNKHSYDAGEVVISETEYHRKVFEGWHAHENNHITFIVRGGTREQRKNKEFDALPGKIIFYRGGERHRNLNTLHPSKNINLEIKDAFFLRHQLNPSAFTPSLFRRPDMKLLLVRIYNECKNNDAQSSAAIHALVLELLASFLEEGAEEKFPRWAVLLREIINDRWSETHSLTELSNLLQVHPVTISKNFSKYFGCSFGEYLRKVKVEKAISMIQKPHDSLTEIAYLCGFADQSHFIRTFKIVTGFRPNEYKKISG